MALSQRKCAGSCWGRRACGTRRSLYCRWRSSSSIPSGSAAGGYEPAFTLAQYANLGSRWAAFRNTLTLAPIGTVAALLIAYPLAYYLALRVGKQWRTLLLVLVIVPFWTSILIRSYAWIFLLGGRGIPNCFRHSGSVSSA